MAITLTIGGSNLSAYLEYDGWSVEQGIEDRCKTAEVRLVDVSKALAIQARDTIDIKDAGLSEQYFYGTVSGFDVEPMIVPSGSARRWIVRGQDDHFELERRVVEFKDYTSASSDLDYIADLFGTYYASGIDYSTFVTGTSLDPAMDDMTFDNITLRQALSEVCGLSGGMFYVHRATSGSLYFHYFDPATGEANNAAWSLSDNPASLAAGSVYGYMAVREANDATMLCNAFHVQGQVDSDWEEDATSESTYGRIEAPFNDQELLSASAVDAAGSALLKKYKDPNVVYTVTTDKGTGLRAGMSIGFEWDMRDVDTTPEIRRIRTYTVMDSTRFDLELGDPRGGMGQGSGGRTVADDLDRITETIRQVEEDVFDTTAPTLPVFGVANMDTGVDLDADGHQNVWVQMTWGSVGDADLHHYDAQLSAASAFDDFVDTRVHPASGSRIERWNGLVGNTTYYGRVRSVDWVGNYSAWATGSILSATDTEAPDQVTGLTAAGARTLIGITWDAASAADLSYYFVQSSSTSGGSWDDLDKCKRAHLIDQDFTEAEIQAGTARWYQVQAWDTSGNSGSWSTSASAATNPLGSDSIAACAIIAGKIAASTISAYHVSTDTIVADHIAASSITATKVSIATLSAITADMGLLTAGEIRVGTGTPGSNFTGFRIFSSYIAGYNNDVAQVYIDSSDGKLYAAGGDVFLDDDGISITGASSITDEGSYKFLESGSVKGKIGASFLTQTINYMEISLQESASAISEIEMTATGAAGYVGQIQLRAYGNSGSTQSFVLLQGDSTDNADSYVIAGPRLFIGESSNANQVRGITLNQLANSDEILSLRSSNVAAVYSDHEADSYGVFQKVEAAAGGLLIRGLKDPNGINSSAIMMQAFLNEASVNTTKSTAGRAVIELAGFRVASEALANMTADGNVFGVRTYRGGATVTILLLDEDGDLHLDGTTAAFDLEDDVMLVRELNDLLAQPRMQVSAKEMSRVVALGIVHEDTHGKMVSTKRHSALLRGALLQVDERLRRLEERV
jgi:hypothetical protein